MPESPDSPLLAGGIAPSTRLAPLRVEAFRDLDLQVRQEGKAIQQELARSRILEAAYRTLADSPGFNPDVALSITFGLKW